MRLKYYSAKKLKKEILNIVGKYLDLKLYKVFFFGSRVKGEGSSRSDIDIGILGSKPIPPEIKFQIEEELENLPTLYKFDLVDFRQVPLRFKKEALKNVEYVE